MLHLASESSGGKQRDADGNQIWQNKTNERLTDFDKAAKLNWDTIETGGYSMMVSVNIKLLHFDII